MAHDEPQLGTLEQRELPRPPFIMIGIFLILVVATWIPLVVFARARVSKTADPRIHLFQDMDIQPKYPPQSSNDVFADGRSMRLPIPGTVARGKLEEDDHFYRGYRKSGNQLTFFTTLPPQVQLTEPLLQRGQQRYGIYCATCHGYDGYGEGPTHRRAIERQEPNWVPPANLHTALVRDREDGHLFNTITNGIRNMAGYGPQISTEDRWAIVAYMRALQLSQNAPASVVPPDRVNSMQ